MKACVLFLLLVATFLNLEAQENYIFLLDSINRRYQEFTLHQVAGIRIESGAVYEGDFGVTENEFIVGNVRIPVDVIDVLQIKKITLDRVLSAPFYAGAGVSAACGILALVLHDAMDEEEGWIDADDKTQTTFLIAGLGGLAGGGILFLVGKLISPSGGYLDGEKARKPRIRKVKVRDHDRILIFDESKLPGIRKYLQDNQYQSK